MKTDIGAGNCVTFSVHLNFIMFLETPSTAHVLVVRGNESEFRRDWKALSCACNRHIVNFILLARKFCGTANVI